MEPCNFEHSNLVLQPPPGGEAWCNPLFALRTKNEDGRPVVITCWKPTQAEIDEIQRTGRLWVMSVGTTIFPISLHATPPFQEVVRQPSGKMKAKCPTCQTGCSECVDGYREVTLADGDWYTRACTNEACLFENGVRISTEKLEGDSGACVRCDARTKWKLAVK